MVVLVPDGLVVAAEVVVVPALVLLANRLPGHTVSVTVVPVIARVGIAQRLAHGHPVVALDALSLVHAGHLGLLEARTGRWEVADLHLERASTVLVVEFLDGALAQSALLLRSVVDVAQVLLQRCVELLEVLVIDDRGLDEVGHALVVSSDLAHVLGTVEQAHVELIGLVSGILRLPESRDHGVADVRFALREGVLLAGTEVEVGAWSAVGLAISLVNAHRAHVPVAPESALPGADLHLEGLAALFVRTATVAPADAQGTAVAHAVA